MNLDPSMYVLIGFLGFAYFVISFFSTAVGLMIMCFAMIFSPEIGVGSIGARSISVRLEDLIIPVLIFAWLANAAVHRRVQGLVKSPLNLPILLLLGMSLVSTLYGHATGWVSPLPAMFYFLKTVEFFCIFYLVVNFVKTEQQIQFFLFCAVSTVILLALYTLPQIPSVEMFTVNRITAPFEGTPEPTTVGGYMVLLLLIFIGFVLCEEDVLKRWLYFGGGVIIFLPLLFTLSRTSYVAFFAGLVFIAFAFKRAWFTFLLLGLLLVAPFLLPEMVMDRIAWTWEDAIHPFRVYGVDASLQQRIKVFGVMWETAKSSPFIGWGITSFQNQDSQYARTIHELGFLGLALWLWVYYRLFRIGRWLFDVLEPGVLKGLALGYQAGVLALLVHAFGSITFYTVRIMEPFWFLSGLVVSLYLLKSREMVRVQT